MLYQRYFKNGQRLLLKALKTEGDGRTELLTGYMDGGGSETFILTLPYSDDASDQYPFSEGMLFELSSEILGLGIRVTGAFLKKIDGKRIALRIKPDLQMFQRRATPRFDCKLGIRFTRGQGALKALRNTWEKNIQILQNPNAPLSLQGFKPCQVNISSGGIRFALRPPVNPAELCLMLINLEDGLAPVCTLAEIIWTRPEQEETIILAGMRFINILEADQKRIDNFIGGQKS
jgi:hypothetical protein